MPHLANSSGTRHDPRLLLHATFTLAAIGTGAATDLFSENFDGLASIPGLSPFVSPSEGGGDGTDWTDLSTAQGSGALPGWTMTRNAGHGPGVTEFDGWTFFDPDSWVFTAGDQNRSGFTKGSGVVAVADSNEFADIAAGADFDATLTTPAIDIAGAAPNSLTLIFDSSWKQEPQVGTVTVSYDGAASVEVLRYDSTTPSLFDETVSISLNQPNGAQTMKISWTKVARNNWWWAIDNVRVTGDGTVTPRLVVTDLGYDHAGNLSITWNSTSTERYRIQTSATGLNGTFSDATGDLSATGTSTTSSITVDPNAVPTLLVRVVQP